MYNLPLVILVLQTKRFAIGVYLHRVHKFSEYQLDMSLWTEV